MITIRSILQNILKIYEKSLFKQMSEYFAEVDLVLLQHPRWNAL